MKKEYTRPKTKSFAVTVCNVIALSVLEGGDYGTEGDENE